MRRNFSSVFDRKIRKTPVPHEQNECIVFNGYLELLQQRHKFYYSHIANGGKRFRKTAIILKKMGVKPGVWDYILRGQNQPVIWLEMKHGNNNLSKEQKEFREFNEALGDRFIIAWSARQALEGLVAIGMLPSDSFFFSWNGAFLLNPKIYPQLS
jgi:hypothetical protein